MSTLTIDKVVKQAHFILLILVAASLAFPIKLHGALVITASVFTVFSIDWRAFINKRIYLSPLLILISLHFVVLVTGLLTTSDIQMGLEELERSVYSIGIVLIIYQFKQKDGSINVLLGSFIVGCVVLSLYGFLMAWLTLDSADFLEVLQNGHRYFTGFISIQPLYLSVYFILIFFFLLETYWTSRNEQRIGLKIVLLILLLFSIGMVFYLRSKTGLIVLPTLLLIYVVVVLKKRGWWVAFILLLVTLLTFLLDKNGPPEIINSYGRTVSHAFDQRLMIWEGAIEGIKEVPFIGAGTGDTQALLNRGYAKIGYEEGIVNNYNTHNQYLQFMARNGLLELIIFLSVLSYSFWRSSKESNYTFLMFNILVSFVMLTESFLSVQKGIVFFYFFLLAFNYLGDKKSEEVQVL